MSKTASAPGKIMLAGEYAVLEGHVAVVAAVNRRANARLRESPGKQSALLRSVAVAVSAVSTDAEERARLIEVDSSAFYTGRDKLGIGSSAATAVAATALALDSADPDTVLRLAFEAHARAQSERGARGSGADIAAAVHGGLVAVRSGGVRPLDVRPLQLPSGLTLITVWTGKPASTAELVAAVAAERDRAGSKYDAAIAELAATSRALIDALSADDAEACVRAIHRGADAVWQLAEATNTPLVSPAHKRLRALAASRGGAAKPTGAGGGDVCLVAFADSGAAQAFRADLSMFGEESPAAGRIVDLSLSVEPAGVTVR